jgi:hypothetical protein
VQTNVRAHGASRLGPRQETGPARPLLRCWELSGRTNGLAFPSMRPRTHQPTAKCFEGAPYP